MLNGTPTVEIPADQKAHEQVVELVEAPPSPSGDDVADALEALGKLTWSELWSTLERLAQRGSGLETMTYLELFRERTRALVPVDPRVMGAINAVLLQRGGRTIQDPNDFSDALSLARALISLPGVDQLEILGRIGVTAVAAEGTIAALFAAAMQAGITVPQFGGLSPAAALRGFTFGDWDRPGQMPVGWYIGTQAHIAIAAHYATYHPPPNHLVALNYVPTINIVLALAKRFRFTPDRLAAVLGASRPDVFDFSMLHPPGWVYEIKPWSLAGVAAAEALVYAEAFNTAGVPTIPGLPGVIGTYGAVPAPNGYYVFESPAPGVIAYQYLRAAEREIRERDAKRKRQTSSDPLLDAGALVKAGVATGVVAIVLIAFLEALKAGGWIILLP